MALRFLSRHVGMLPLFVCLACTACGEARRDSYGPDQFGAIDEPPAPLPTTDQLLGARYVRAMQLEPLQERPGDRPVLRIGGSSFDLLEPAGERERFDPTALRAPMAGYRDPGITCLCGPQPWGGLALYDQWDKHLGWILFNANHNGWALVAADGRPVDAYRFQREGERDGVFVTMEDTVDVAAIAATYGLVHSQP